MVHPSTQQTVDRILGTAAILSLSVVLVRRLLHHHHHPSYDDNDNNDSNHSKWRCWARYWLWSGWASDSDTVLQRRWKRETQNKRTENVNNDKRMYEHLGSCHCGSIQFLLQGPKRLHAIDTPGKIRFPHVSIPANKFHLVSGQDHMRFYYEDTITDDSSSITFDILPGGGGAPSLVLDAASAHSDDATRASCAFCFCGNCGVHVFHADRSLGMLEINSNCLDGREAKLLYREDLQHASSLSSSKHALHNDKSSSTKSCTVIETVSENEPFLGGSVRLVHDIHEDHNIITNNLNHCNESNVLLRAKESSMSSLDPTQPDTYSTAMMAESDDLSMASSSITGGVSLTQYHSLLSIASSVGATVPASSSSSVVRERIVRTGLPPRPHSSISRISPSNRSVSTLPPWLDGRSGGYYGNRGGLNSMGGSGSSWSVASIESHEFDGMDTSSTISPKMRDQMKKYLSSHMSKK